MKPATRTRLLGGHQPLTDVALAAAAPQPERARTTFITKPGANWANFVIGHPVMKVSD